MGGDDRLPARATPKAWIPRLSWVQIPPGPSVSYFRRECDSGYFRSVLSPDRSLGMLFLHDLDHPLVVFNRDIVVLGDEPAGC